MNQVIEYKIISKDFKSIYYFDIYAKKMQRFSSIFVSNTFPKKVFFF